MPRTLLFILVAAHAALALRSAARAQDDALPADPGAAEYQALVEEALRESAAGRWEEARVLFRRAHAVQPNARTLRGIGMVAYELRDYTDAVRHLALALQDERRPLTPEQRAQTERLLENAYELVGRYDLGALPEGAALVVDGLPAELEPDGSIVLRVGPHHAEVRAEHRAWEARWTVRGGEHEPLPIVFTAEPELEPEPRAPLAEPPAPRVRRTPDAGWVVALGGAGVAIVGAVLLAIGLADIATVESAASGTEWAELAGAYERAPVLTSAGVGVIGLGAALGVAGGVWLAVGEEAPAPSAAGLRIGGAF